MEREGARAWPQELPPTSTLHSASLVARLSGRSRRSSRRATRGGPHALRRGWSRQHLVPSSRVAAGGGRGFARSASGSPHSPQYCSPGSALAPHEGQLDSSPAPQWTQNFRPARFSCLQEGQNISPAPWRAALDHWHSASGCSRARSVNPQVAAVVDSLQSTYDGPSRCDCTFRLDDAVRLKRIGRARRTRQNGPIRCARSGFWAKKEGARTATDTRVPWRSRSREG
jgi:hypothetical protein